MSLIQKIKIYLRDDPLIRRVLRNSSYLFSSNTISAALGFVQGIFVVRLLGIEKYGAISAVILFTSNVNRLLSFRMSEVLVKYMGEALAQGHKDRAAALAKWVGITEAVTSVFAYLVLYVLAPWFSKDPTLTSLYRFYGVFLLANIIYETATGVLQVTDKFKRVAFANLLQSIVTAVLIITAFLMQWDMFEILTAYLVGKTLAAFIITHAAIQELKHRLGNEWTHASLTLITDWKAIGRFALSTNINGTVNLFARDNVPLYIKYFVSDVALGYFRLASSLINLVMLPIEPFIWPTYKEITNTIAQRQWQATRKLLKQVSTIAGIWTLFAGGGLIALGWWFIPFVYGSDSAPAYVCVLVLLIGYSFANIMNWNRPLLLALGEPTYLLMVAAITGVIEIICIFVFVPRGGYLIGAAIFSAYLAVSISINVLRGLSMIKNQETLA